MLVLVVRHGCAGDKTRWPGPDTDRPLDRVGTGQAAALAGATADVALRRVVASATRRCRDTVVPMAERRGLAVETSDDLAVGSDRPLLATVLDPASADAALCTHGELLRPFLAAVRPTAAIEAERHDDDWLARKGTAWLLTVEAGTVVALRHIAPGPARPCTADAWPVEPPLT